MSTTVEVLVEAFRDAGTPFIVGHPGGESVEMIQAARERDMRFILMKQEVAGGMLASTWGEARGGVLLNIIWLAAIFLSVFVFRSLFDLSQRNTRIFAGVIGLWLVLLIAVLAVQGS